VQVGGNVQLLPETGVFIISIEVGEAYNGRIVNVYRSEDGDNWELNSPDETCTVADAICTFATDHLSYFAPAEIVALPSNICIGIETVPQSECEALISLYNNTNGTNRKTNTNR